MPFPGHQMRCPTAELAHRPQSAAFRRVRPLEGGHRPGGWSIYTEHMASAHPLNLWTAIDTAGPASLDARVRPAARSAAQVRSEVSRLLGEPPAQTGVRRTELILALALLWHDRLGEAHALVQEREGDADADLLHALLHRREGDYGNAKYWFSAAGAHPTFPALAAEAQARTLPALTQGGTWSPASMVEAVRLACTASAPAEALIAIQRLEFASLCAYLIAS